MSAARILRRKLISDKARRAKPENRPLKKGTVFKHVVNTHMDGPYEVAFHVTKGVRKVRLHA